MLSSNSIYYYGQPALQLNWIHSKIIGEATVRIIGLTKIAFLLLGWIYLSIRIMLELIKFQNIVT